MPWWKIFFFPVKINKKFNQNYLQNAFPDNDTVKIDLFLNIFFSISDYSCKKKKKKKKSIVVGKIQKQIMKPSIRTFYIKFFTVNKTWSAPPTPRLINNCHLSCNPLLSPTFCKSPKALTLFLILLFKVWDQTLSRRRGLILWTIATFLYLQKSVFYQENIVADR